ncbi:hypothetical protein Tco_0725458 [Tanacetum coccineum]|uniref:Uncharacterized protein n=1 Tax=Tanacetum coccineum TaxID=301880 RepID=A0ABQ4YF43_9ASTR
MLRRNLRDTLRRKGCDDSFLRWSMLWRNPSGMLRRKVPWALHFGAFLVQIPCRKTFNITEFVAHHSFSLYRVLVFILNVNWHDATMKLLAEKATTREDVDDVSKKYVILLFNQRRQLKVRAKRTNVRRIMKFIARRPSSYEFRSQSFKGSLATAAATFF